MRVGLFVITLAVLTAPPSFTQNITLPFAVGAWSADAIILPFAAFDGESWRTIWREPSDAAPDLPAVADIPREWWGGAPLAMTWEVLRTDGSRFTANVIGTEDASLGSGCSLNVGLMTDANGKTFRALAANRPGVIFPVHRPAATSEEWRAVDALLPWIFQRYEPPIWREVSDEYRPDLSVRLRPTLDAVFTTIDDQGQFLYFEARRDYTLGPGRMEQSHAFIQGWLWRRSRGASLQAIHVQAGVRDGDGKGPRVFRPLGLVKHNQTRFWLGGLSAYTYGGLVVFEVRRDAIREAAIIDYPGC
jgi:hypothetical protein